MSRLLLGEGLSGPRLQRMERTMSVEQKNIELVKDLYAAFGRGDLAHILERFAPELEAFGVTANGRTKAPWHFAGRRRVRLRDPPAGVEGAQERQHFADEKRRPPVQDQRRQSGRMVRGGGHAT